MRTPKTTTLLCVAGGFLLLTAILVPNYYPAPVPILGADGAPVLGTDGKPLIHRDMAGFHRMMLPGYVSLICFFIFTAWLLVRVLRLVYEHFTRNAENR